MSHTRDHIIIQKIRAVLTTVVYGPVKVWHVAGVGVVALLFLL